MRRLTGMLSAVAVATFTSLSSAQERPDFSGVWTSSPGTAATDQGARSTGPVGSGWGWTFTITQDAAGLTVVQPFYTRADLQPPLTFRYLLDGSESVNTLLMGRGVQLHAHQAVVVACHDRNAGRRKLSFDKKAAELQRHFRRPVGNVCGRCRYFTA